MLDLVLLEFIPSAHFGKLLHRAELVRKFNLATLRVVGLRQSVIGHLLRCSHRQRSTGVRRPWLRRAVDLDDVAVGCTSAGRIHAR